MQNPEYSPQQAEIEFQELVGQFTQRMRREENVVTIILSDPEAIGGHRLVLRRDGTWCTSSSLDISPDEFSDLNMVLARVASFRDPDFRQMQADHLEQWRGIRGATRGLALEKTQAEDLASYILTNHQKLFGELTTAMQIVLSGNQK